ncbi:MAG: bacillithiol biosynthesis deacetylase BshB1 [Bacteroidota bacterium]|nr:bacillithiol biosynthesis deacetylase BshB1 [Bacteroidota bacterium]
MTLDVIAIGAHPDDVELCTGGTLAQLVAEGYRVGIVDCTRGELGTRGSAQRRMEEARKAQEILGVHVREVLDFPDSRIEPTEDAIVQIVRLFRQYRPRLVLFPPAFERHPDHEAVHRIVRNAYFKSGLGKLRTFAPDGTEHAPYRPARLLCYIQAYHHEPDLLVDISATFEQKMQAIKAYSSQVYVPGESPENEPETVLSRPDFLEAIEARARYWGSLIGTRYAEGFLTVEPLGLHSLSALLR